LMPMLAPVLRAWDANTSLRVDRFVANSDHVAARIRKYYRRPATVVYPPVAVEDFMPTTKIEDFYLCAGQIVPYKRVDLAVQAFTRMQKNLIVIGDGKASDIAHLKRIAGPTVRFLGRAAFPVLKSRLAACRALIFPGEEDFGMVPIEAMASGRPVIAYGSGGARETVVHRKTGLLFGEQSVESLMDAVSAYEAIERLFIPETIRMHAARFSLHNFRRSMQEIIDAELNSNRSARSEHNTVSVVPRDREPVVTHSSLPLH
jgi:glycosyltransferase involved in cell wall biosynthesis